MYVSFFDVELSKQYKNFVILCTCYIHLWCLCMDLNCLFRGRIRSFRNGHHKNKYTRVLCTAVESCGALQRFISLSLTWSSGFGDVRDEETRRRRYKNNEAIWRLSKFSGGGAPQEEESRGRLWRRRRALQKRNNTVAIETFPSPKETHLL